ncbi:YidH family protein [Roseimaritima sediminicola]|uniref:YidH family protein n=1 Tax=Roseimaritima sediminicola TaxID=2662066 RepID=UPI0012982429|nr:DUF202 domain-containing protein [Roseimaritima sediminicola]
MNQDPDQSEHDSANDRTLMAEERTFSAWVRTGLTSMATGLGIVKLLPQAEASWAMKALGVVLIAVGGLAFAFGFAGYRRGRKHWSGAHGRAVPLWMLSVFSVLLIAATVLAFLALLPN